MSDEAARGEARLVVLGWLNRRRHSIAEVRRKLRQKGVAVTTAAEVIAELRAVGLLDDHAFAVAYVRDGVRLLGRGRLRLRRELLARGVAADLADEVLAAEAPREAEPELARQLAEQRLRRLRGQPPLVARRRLAGFLERRGIGSAVIAALLNELVPWTTPDPDDPDD